MGKGHLIKLILPVLFLLLNVRPSSVQAQKKKKNNNIKLLLIDGQSKNHKNWKEWTPVLLKELNDSGLFLTDVYTAPGLGNPMKAFNPQFKDYDVIVSLYDGDNWPEKTRRHLEKYMAKGGGLVVVHAAGNAFPDWPAYQEMTGADGLEKQTEKAGQSVDMQAGGKTTQVDAPGNDGHHGASHEFQVTNLKPEHPIMKGLPEKWMHTADELCDHLTGTSKNMEVLATALSDDKYGGNGLNEPVLMAVRYGKGRVFQTTMGHDRLALSGVGFMAVFVRGCEWAATGKVTFPVPDDFPKPEKSRKSDY